MSKRFQHIKQQQSRECGAVCLRMVAKHYGRLFTTESLLELARQREEGATLLGISEAAEAIGMHSVAAKLPFTRLIDDIPLPGIAHWKGNHFVVVIEAGPHEVVIADPAYDGVITVPKAVFLEGWVGDPTAEEKEGVLLLLEPTTDFETKAGQEPQTIGLKYIWNSFVSHRKLMPILFVGMAIGLFLMLVFPFIIQTMIDEGIENKDTNLLYLILFAWMLLFIGQVGLDMARSFITFHIGSKVNIRLVTSFMQRIMQLPLRFFKSRMPDDVIQLLYDNPKVQRFLTSQFFSVLYSGCAVILFSFILLHFSWQIFLVLLLFSAFQVLAVLYFMQKRQQVSYDRHELAAAHFSTLSDIIRGISDIRLNNATRTKRWVWERSEARLYRVNQRIFKTGEYSRQLPFYLSEIRNILIIFFSAKAVMDGSMTVGVLVAVVFILTQLNNPIKNVVDFLIGYQETMQTIRRMNEIKSLDTFAQDGAIDVLPKPADLEGLNVSFRYEGENSPWIIRNLDFKIVCGKSTAVVGQSGSGKTTLLNLILKFYHPEEGSIKIGDVPLKEISDQAWLEKCGVVQQDGHIFYETIARNIALGAGTIDSERLLEAARIAHVLPFLERLRDGFQTVVGEGGVGLSKGQKQCILIARAIYKNPDYLFLDEATNDIDPDTERQILDRILHAFSDKTVVVFANRMPPELKVDEVIPIAIPRLRSKDAGELSSRRGSKIYGLDELNLLN